MKYERYLCVTVVEFDHLLSEAMMRALRILPLLITIWACFGQAWADVDRNDFQTIDTVTLQMPVTEKLSVLMEGRNYVRDNWQNQLVLMLQPSLIYQVHPNVSVAQGYAKIFAFEPGVGSEQRLWQQVQINRVLGKEWGLSVRSRLEERFIEGVSGTGLRLREQIKLTRPLPFNKKYYVVLSNEAWINLNKQAPGTELGYQQNWAYIGLGRRFLGSSNVEVGYMPGYVYRKARPDQVNHILTVNLNYVAPKPLFRSRTVKMQ